MLPPLPRVPEAQELVENGSDFVLHASRPSGKRTFLMACARALTQAGQYAALCTRCEIGEASDDATASRRAPRAPP
jgi:hypothetical protein